VRRAPRVGVQDPHAADEHSHLGDRQVQLRCPVLLRGEANARPVGAAAHVGPAEGGCRSPGGPDQLGGRQPGIQNPGLQRGRVLRVDQGVVHFGDGVLPYEFPVRRQIAEVARGRTQVAVRQLEPGPGERVLELLRVVEPARRDLAVGRVDHLQCEIGGEHHRRMPLRRIVGIRHQVRRGAAGGPPLGCTAGAPGLLPLVPVQILEKVVGPRRGIHRPRALQAAGDGVPAVARAVAVRPTEALRLDIAALRLDTDVQGRIGGAVALPKVWPPAISAAVSSSFIAMRPKASRIACAADCGSELPPGPWGFT